MRKELYTYESLSGCITPLNDHLYKIVDAPVVEDPLRPSLPARFHCGLHQMIYLGESLPVCSGEIYGTQKPANAATSLTYKVSGRFLDISKIRLAIVDVEFGAKWNDCGRDKHQYSQEFASHLNDIGMLDDIDGIMWPSVSGDFIGIEGYCFLCKKQCLTTTNSQIWPNAG